MQNKKQNRKREFADVVTADAWHKSFQNGRRADLHVDVVFGTARLGGEEESPIRFHLSISRAEVVVVISPAEPVSIDRTSVSRDAPVMTGTLTKITERRTDSKIGAKLRAALRGSSPKVDMQASAGTERVALESERLEMSRTAQLFLITQNQDVDGQYRWMIEAQGGIPLKGRPWSPLVPRLALVDDRIDCFDDLPPTVSIAVRCRREDLKIENLEIKDKRLWTRVRSTAGYPNRLAAAESYIRDRLAKEGLQISNFGDKFGELTLCETIAEPTD